MKSAAYLSGEKVLWCKEVYDETIDGILQSWRPLSEMNSRSILSTILAPMRKLDIMNDERIS